jgi:hypothetical protein
MTAGRITAAAAVPAMAIFLSVRFFMDSPADQTRAGPRASPGLALTRPKKLLSRQSHSQVLTKNTIKVPPSGHPENRTPKTTAPATRSRSGEHAPSARGAQVSLDHHHGVGDALGLGDRP